MLVPTTALLASLFALPALPADQGSVEPPSLPTATAEGLWTWLAAHGQSPHPYVVDLFAEHDVVFLGEQHRVKHDVLFVASLLEPLYAAGVRSLGLEFGRREDQPLIDWLLARSEWDEELAREIVFRNFVWWGYREYVDIYKAAWRLNRSLPHGAPPFRILGLNDSPDWSIVKTRADLDDSAIKKRVWRGGGEAQWARVILEAVQSGEKILVFCGIHHAFTRYRQPIVIDGQFSHFDRDLRAGNHVAADLGTRAVTVFLHAPWAGAGGYGSAMRHPAGGIIDALMLARGPRPVGFTLAGGPFGELRIEDAVYRHGYEQFTLSDFCDGWIYIKPISQSEGVTPIPDWVNERNLDRARQQSPTPDARAESIEYFNSGIAASADIPGRWSHLQ